MDVSLKYQPKVLVHESVNRKMEAIIDMVDAEVGWFGLVQREDGGIFRLLDVYILKQEVNGATTEINGQDLARLSDALYDEGIITEENQNNKGLYMWGHSHDMGAPSPSSQDNDQFKYLYNVNKPPFFIRLIQNKKRERLVDLYIEDTGSSIQDYIIIRDIPFEIDSKEITEMKEALKKEIEEKVTHMTMHTTYSYSGKSNYGMSYTKRADEYYENGAKVPSYSDNYDPADSLYGYCCGENAAYKNAVNEMNEIKKLEKGTKPEKSNEVAYSPRVISHPIGEPRHFMPGVKI